ncbi:MAG: hypothetical protein OEV40_00490 [Acidimicrobiia bacterium]|nr:hypothetical protein [Acidimicrobiia bacterium]
MGAQDSLDQAVEFVATTGVETPLMLWDTGFDSWIYYGVNGQPIAILVDADGNPLQGWRGPFDVDEVLRLAAEV